jgi:hypothetical protein
MNERRYSPNGTKEDAHMNSVLRGASVGRIRPQLVINDSERDTRRIEMLSQTVLAKK